MKQQVKENNVVGELFRKGGTWWRAVERTGTGWQAVVLKVSVIYLTDCTNGEPRLVLARALGADR
jgi:hypothetical protein